MWILVINEIRYVLKSGTWSIGRKSCDINISEKSVSRHHANIIVHPLLNVNDLSSRPLIEYEEQKAKFGTIHNDKKVQEKNLPLAEDDILQLGIGNFIKVVYENFAITISRVRKKIKMEMIQIASELDIHFSNVPISTSKLCITEPPTVATIKVLWSLVYEQSIVSPQYLLDMHAKWNLQNPFLSFENYLPQDQSTNETDLQFYVPHISRKSLFGQCQVLFLMQHDFEQMIPLMEGDLVLVYEKETEDEMNNEWMKEVIDKGHVAQRVSIVIQPQCIVAGNASKKVQEWFTTALSLGCKVIKDGDLATTILFMRNPIEFAESMSVQEEDDLLDSPVLTTQSMSMSSHKRKAVDNLPSLTAVDLTITEESQPPVRKRTRLQSATKVPSPAPMLSVSFEKDAPTQQSTQETLQSFPVSPEELESMQTVSTPVTSTPMFSKTLLKTRTVTPKTTIIPIRTSEVEINYTSGWRSTAELRENTIPVENDRRKSFDPDSAIAEDDVIMFEEPEAILTHLVLPTTHTASVQDEGAGVQQNFKKFKKGNKRNGSTSANFVPFARKAECPEESEHLSQLQQSYEELAAMESEPITVTRFGSKKKRGKGISRTITLDSIR